jgi:hypothetical protein
MTITSMHGNLTIADVAKAKFIRYSTLAEAETFDPSVSKRLFESVGQTTSPALFKSNWTNSNCNRRSTFVHQDKYTVVSLPFAASDESTKKAIMVGSLGDSSSQAIPVKIGIEVFTSHFIAMVTIKEAERFNLQQAVEDPHLMEGPKPDSGEAEAPGLERISWPPVKNADDAPVFVAMPVVSAVPQGVPLPEDQRVDQEADTGDDSNDAMAFLRLYKKATKHVLKYNKGFSYFADESVLFKKEDFDHSQFKGVDFVNSIDVQLEAVSPFSEKDTHKTVLDVVSKQRDATMMELLANDNIPSTPPATPTTTVGLSNQAADKASRPTPKQQEMAEHAESTELFYRILLAKQVGSTIEVAELSDTFKAFLREPSGPRATKRLQQHVKTMGEECRDSDSIYGTRVSLSPERLDVPICAALRDAEFVEEPLGLSTAPFKTKISVIHLAPVDPASVEYIERIEDGQKILLQERVGEDKSHIGRRTIDIFGQVQLSSNDDILATMANWFLIIKVMDKDFKPNDGTILWTILQDWDKTLRSKNAVTWLAVHKNLPHIPCQILLFVQRAMSMLATIANNTHVRSAVINHQPIDPKVFQQVFAGNNLARSEHETVCLTGRLGPYSEVPLLHSCIKGYNPQKRKALEHAPAADKKKQALSPPNRDAGSRRNNQSPAQQNGGAQQTPNAQNNTKDKTGWLRWTGQNYRIPSYSFPNPKQHGNLTPICQGFVFQGRACKFGESCNFMHFKKAADIPAEQQQKFKDFVNKTPDMDWSNPAQQGG